MHRKLALHHVARIGPKSDDARPATASLEFWPTDMTIFPIPCPEDVLDARRTLVGVAVKTPILRSDRLDRHKPGDVLIMKTGITHALSNHSAESAIFISAPVAKQ